MTTKGDSGDLSRRQRMRRLLLSKSEVVVEMSEVVGLDWVFAGDNRGEGEVWREATVMQSKTRSEVGEGGET